MCSHSGSTCQMRQQWPVRMQRHVQKRPAHLRSFLEWGSFIGLFQYKYVSFDASKLTYLRRVATSRMSGISLTCEMCQKRPICMERALQKNPIPHACRVCQRQEWVESLWFVNCVKRDLFVWKENCKRSPFHTPAGRGHVKNERDLFGRVAVVEQPCPHFHARHSAGFIEMSSLLYLYICIYACVYMYLYT